MTTRNFRKMSYRRLTKLSSDPLTASPAKEELKRRAAASVKATKSSTKVKAGGDLERDLQMRVLETAEAVRELIIFRLIAQVSGAIKIPRL